MSETTWSAVDRYLVDSLVHPDPAFAAILARSQEAGLPSINVSPVQGKLLMVLALAVGARRILEIGTLGGYSAAWLARGLAPGGRVVTIEFEPRHAEVARANLQAAGVSDAVEILVGPAADVLDRLAAEGAGPYDLVFIDADRPHLDDYLRLAVRLARPGTLIVADNVVRGGRVVDGGGGDPDVDGVRRFNQAVAADPRLEATALQTVGVKGYDGLAIVVVTGG